MTTVSEQVAVDATELAKGFRGEFVRRDDAGYDEHRAVWNGSIDRHPGLIARCAGVADVIAAVSFARENGLPVAVRSGGHSFPGHSVCDDGLVIDLSLMKGVRVDPDARTARVQAGVLLGELDRETQAFGLAVPAGIVTHTGVAGLTLGGGIGWLMRKFGLTIDQLQSVDLVTAGGDFVKASNDENADLFWGVRGAGANFGVVTSFEFRLHPVGPGVLGGVVIHPLAKAKAALSFYYEYSHSAPDELCADAFFLTSPDGDPVFAISVCYIGPMEEGERVLEPLRRFGPPLADEVGPVAYTELQAVGDVFFPAGLNYYWKSHFLKEITNDALEATVSHFARVPSPRSLIVFQQFGGAVSRVAHSETAFRHRNAQYDNFAASIWTDPRDVDMHQQWVREWWDMMNSFSIGAEYVNNLGEEGEDRVRAAYGDNYERLVALKHTYDPTNFFRLNANIQPSA